jgi:type IX secretion system PorP/SprF family membrane protein
MKINHKNCLLKLAIVTIILSSSIVQVRAQINPLGAQYFQNRYLANPAMAGYQSGLSLNLGYRNQWNTIPGSPKNISVTGDYGTKKVGVGFNFYKDEAGLLSRSRLQASYAYHLPLNDESKKLHFGISLGIQAQYLTSNDIIGSPNDLMAARFNNQEKILDGDFGMAYTSNTLIIEGSITNLKSQLKVENLQPADFSTFYTAISYKIKLSELQIEPKVVYRGVRNFQDIIDLGAEIRTATEQLGFMSIYHSNKSMSFGLSYQQKKDWQLFLLYNTPTQALKSYATGTFEVGLQLNLIKKK